MPLSDSFFHFFSFMFSYAEPFFARSSLMARFLRSVKAFGGHHTILTRLIRTHDGREGELRKLQVSLLAHTTTTSLNDARRHHAGLSPYYCKLSCGVGSPNVEPKTVQSSVSTGQGRLACLFWHRDLKTRMSKHVSV